MPAPLIEAEHLYVEYKRRGHTRGDRSALVAVNDVSLSLEPHESLGIEGESGSGKSSLVSALIGTVPVARGEVRIDGRPATARSRQKLQMVYQDPLSSLNPRIPIGRMIAEVVRVHSNGPRLDPDPEVSRLLGLVGLGDAFRDKLPHQLSGGQRQRACIARAIAASPEVLILDEAVAALDVSIQAAVLATVRDLQRSLGVAVMFISHDLAVIRNSCSRMLVMTEGRVVESGSTDDVFDHPQHPYTKSLLASSPEIRSRPTLPTIAETHLTTLKGTTPS